MKTNAASQLDPIHLLKIYGQIDFYWDLVLDTMEWQGPLTKLISPDRPLRTGSSYNHCLDPQNFWKRLKEISTFNLSDQSYESHYTLRLQNHQMAHVYEQGQVISEQGNPKAIKGKVYIDDASPPDVENLSGYDALTGLPEKQVLYETLASLLDQAQENQIPGAYLTVTFDQLGYLNCKYGVDIVSRIFKIATKHLRSCIRFDDTLGRISGPALGVILKKCDRWGIVRVTDRLSKILEGKKISTPVGDVPIHVSIGGIVFPDKDLTADIVMKKAEKCLFEAQSMKSMGVVWTPYGENVDQDLKRPERPKESKNRTEDRYH